MKTGKNPACSALLFILLCTTRSLAGDNRDLATRLERATVMIMCGARGAFGSGTVVERRGNEAVIATCGHLFRGLTGPVDVEVTFFGEDGRHRYPGRAVSYDQHLDVGLVRVADAPLSPVIPIARRGREVEVNAEVMVAGCESGEPQAKLTRITANGRYAGRPNIEVAAIPESGRSGGALVTEDGYLLGICNAYSPVENDGIYASVEALHRLKSKLNERPEIASSQPRSIRSVESDRIVARSHYAVETTDERPRSGVKEPYVLFESENGDRYEISSPSDQLLKLLRKEGRPITGRR